MQKAHPKWTLPSKKKVEKMWRKSSNLIEKEEKTEKLAKKN